MKALRGREIEVLVEGPSDESEYVLMGRHEGQAPEIDGQVYLTLDEDYTPRPAASSAPASPTAPSTTSPPTCWARPEPPEQRDIIDE